MADSKQEIVQRAKFAEQVFSASYIFRKIYFQAERFDDMVQAMKLVTEMGSELSVEERNLFSVAYKNVVGARRSSWRSLSNCEQRAANAENAEWKVKIAKEYRQQIEQELRDLCNEVLVSFFLE